MSNSLDLHNTTHSGRPHTPVQKARSESVIFWERVSFYKATEVFTLGSMHMLLWNAPERPDDADNSLTKITPVPMPAEIIEPFERRFGVQIMGQGMAQSEAMRVISQQNHKKPWPPGSCGSATRKHPAVADCAAFGIPSEELDSEQELKLNCVLHPEQAPTEEELARYINKTAPYFFVPRYIEFVASLTYTPTNKVQKYKLREIGLTPNTWDAQQAGFKATR